MCAEPKCIAPAEPEGDARVIGHDHDGEMVWMQRWCCVMGHRYDVELPLFNWGDVRRDEA